MHHFSLRFRNLLFVLIILSLIILATACQGLSSSTPTPFPAQEISAAGEEPEVSATPTLEETAIVESEAGQDSKENSTPTPSLTKKKPTAKPVGSPTKTQPPTATPIPTSTPTSAPQFAPVLQIQEPQPVREGVSTPATAIPTAVPEFSIPSGTTNILL